MQVKFPRNVTKACNQVATIIKIKKGIMEPREHKAPAGFRMLNKVSVCSSGSRSKAQRAHTDSQGSNFTHMEAQRGRIYFLFPGNGMKSLL